MTRDELPEELHCPGANLGPGQVFAQFEDGDDHVFLAWGSQEAALHWLQNGGIPLWEEKRNGITKFDIVLIRENTETLVNMMTSGGESKNAVIRYEPDVGTLGVPDERRIPLG
jgi:hypothetical protein